MSKAEPKKVMPKKVMPKKSVAREPIVEKSAPKKQSMAPKASKKSELTITAELQYSGKAIPIAEIYSRAKEACGNDSDIKIYIKPEENRVYYVSGDSAGSFEI